MTGVVLAGGRSSRFGGDKLTAPYRGAPLLHHVVLRLAEVCDDVVVVTAPGVEPSLPVGVPARVVHDPTEGEGPLAGTHAGLLAVRTGLALLAGGDMPAIQAPVLLELVRVAREAPVEAVALQDADRFRPLPSVMRAGQALDVAHLLLHAGDRRLRSLLRAMTVAVVDEPTWTALDPDRRTLFDVDERDDLTR